MKSKSGKLGSDDEQVELLVAPLVGPKNSVSEGEEDSDSPVREEVNQEFLSLAQPDKRME